MNKLRRGELRFRLPVGFVHDAQGRVTLDPDEQIRQTLHALFQTFRRVGTANATARNFQERGLKFPSRVHGGPHLGELTWGALSGVRVSEVLHNPCYAGAYAYGRRQQQHLGLSEQRVVRPEPRERWHILRLGAHPGYITWQEYEENLQRLAHSARATAQAHKSPPGEGPALLQGLALCGACGGHTKVRYHVRAGALKPEYLCQGTLPTQPAQRCPSIPGSDVDAAIGAMLVEIMAPAALDVALQVCSEIQSRSDEADRLRRQGVERASYEAELARRRFMQVDPEHRLVANTLEAEWNDRLRTLERLRAEYQHQREADRLELDAAKQARIRELTSDFPRLWRDPRTSDRDRKRMVRLLIEDVTLAREQDEIAVHVRFKGGATRSLRLARPRASWELRRLPRPTVDEIDRLLEEHTDNQIAEILNTRGTVSGTGKRFDGQRVRAIRRAYHLRSRQQRLQARGLLTLREIAAKLDVTTATIKLWRRQGRLPLRCYLADDNLRYLYEDPALARQRSDP
jgi:hypothetical protein